MTKLESVIPEITDDDIEWVRAIMDLNPFDAPRREFLKCRKTVDLTACPGSGKTTLIVAKLVILARKWPHRSRGLCVLSHTNVARKQIEDNLYRTVAGQKLLAYPHFIDTIHSFVNRFLALPWLYSNGYPTSTIDDDVTTAYRRGILGSSYWGVQKFLENKRTSFDKLRICGRDFSFDLDGKPFPAGPSTTSFLNAKRAVETAAQHGYFCYDEMFVWAEALLEDHSRMPAWLAHRFPLVMLDEMQDTSERQASFLNSAFPRLSDGLVVQRVGDPNQAIFDISDTKASTVNKFPDSNLDRCISVPNSYRFGKEIAKFASPFAVNRVGTNGLTGIGPKGVGPTPEECRHAVFIFPDNTTNGVLDVYGKHTLSVLGEELTKQGLVTAVGHIHQDDPDVSPGHAHYPKSVGHYWDGYSVELSRKDSCPSTLAQYVRAAQGLVANEIDLSSGVDKIASGILRLARRIGDIDELKRRVHTHRTIVETLENKPDVLATYREILRVMLIDRTPLSEENWPFYYINITLVASALCSGETSTDKAKKFLDWPQNDLKLIPTDESLSNDAGPNIYRVNSADGSIDIQLGSIHSVKGQTHLATLLLTTYWYGPSARHMMPWLLGQRVNGNNAGIRDIQRLLSTYVAMTRPSHLLCLALPRSIVGDDQAADATITTLRGRGWRVAEIIDGIALWRD